MAEDRPRSYLVAASPKAQYDDLNESLAAQVVDARKNLLGTFNTMEPLEEDARVNLNSTGDDCIKVFLRVRPFTAEEIVNKEDKNCFQIIGTSVISTNAPPESNSFKNAQHFNVARETNEFTFTKVFGSEMSQKQVFDSTSSDLVRQFIDGQNALIFSYGVTNAGKTYTIQGTENDPGIIPRALDGIFAIIRDKLLPEPYFKPKLYHDVVKCEAEDRKMLSKLKETVFRLAELDDVEVDTNLTKASSSSECSLASSTHSVNDLIESDSVFSAGDIRCSSAPPCDVGYLVYISFAEIYNEHVYDLFEPAPVDKGKRRNILKLSEDRHGNIYVKGLTEINITTTEEALKLLAAGQKNLRFASTKLNYNSSRRLTFCDLAGSERSVKTENSGDRVKESGCINTSLLNLGRCISLLRWNQSHRDNQQIIPFRDSKLTRIFQNFLVGRGKACMIINISQCASCFDETLHVLKFSAVVKKVKQSTANELAVNHPTYLLVRPPVGTFRLENTAVASQQKSLPEVIVRDSASPICEEGDEESSVFDTTLADNQQQIQKYQLVIEDLRAQLLEEKRKYLRAEQKIREEVCREYAKHMSDMEEKLTEARQEGIQNAEDLADERIELYIQTVKKSQHKERRMTIDPEAVGDDEGDGWVPEAALQAEKIKLKEKENEIAQLKAQLNLPHKKSEHFVQKPSTSDASENEDLVSALEAKTKECQDLSEMLAEAGETFKANSAEIVRLQQCVADLEDRLRNNKDILNAPVTSVIPKSDYVERLEARVAELEENAKEIASAHLREHDTLKNELDESRRTVAEITEKLSKVENETHKLPVEPLSSLKTSEAGSAPPDTPTSIPEESMNDGFKCIELESKIFELEKTVEQLNVRNQSLKQSLEEVEEREKALKTLNVEFEKQLQQKTQVALSSGQLRTQLQRAESKIVEIEQQLKDSQSKENRLKKDCRKFEEEAKEKSVTISSLETELTDFRSKFETAQQNVLRLQSANDECLVQQRQLETQLNECREKLDDVKKQLSDSIEENRREKETVKNLSIENERKFAELNRELDSVKKLLSSKNEEIESLKKIKQTTSVALEEAEKKIEQLEKEHKAEVDKQKNMSSNFDALKKSLETATHSLFEKNVSISQLEEDKKSTEQTLLTLKTDLEQVERNHLEATNKLLQELDSAKNALVEVKKSKIETADLLQSVTEECARLKEKIQFFENKLELERANNERIIADSLQNEKLIETYKTAINDQAEVQQNLQSLLKDKNAEVLEANRILQEAKEKVQKTENAITVLQKENSRIKHDLELRSKVEEKLKSDLAELETKLKATESMLRVEKQNVIAKESELAKSNAAQQIAGQKRIDEYKTELLSASEKIENLTKELRTKDTFVNVLNGKMAEKEQTLKVLESEIKKVENAHKDMLAGKERQLEAWKQQKEALIVEVENLKRTNKGLTDENEHLKTNVSEKDSEISRLKTEKLPPLPTASSTTARRRKQASTSVEEEANQVEVTPMISKKISQVSRGRSTVDKGEVAQQSESSRRKTSTSADVRKRLTEDNDSPSQYSVGEVNAQDKPVNKGKGRKPRATSTSKSKVKTVAVLTDDNSPLQPANKPVTETLPLEIPDESTGRPSRKAKSTARNGIFAVSTYLRNSPNAESSTTEPDVEHKSNKRRKRLYKSPVRADLSTPPPAAAAATTTTTITTTTTTTTPNESKQSDVRENVPSASEKRKRK